MSGLTLALIIGGSVFAGLLVCGGIAAALLLPAVQQARHAARMTQSKNNLKQIGLAVHNYHDTFGTLPIGATFDDTGRALHGWQTRILPFVDQPQLYNRVNWNAPWDDPTNTGVMSVPVPQYLDPNVGSPLQGPRGYGLSHYAGNSQVLLPNGSLKIREITDGTSNTILAGQAAGNYQPWGDPTNLRDPAAGLNAGPNTFGSKDPGGVQVLMMDGAVRVINPGIDPDVLKALATPSGGEAVGAF